MATNDFSFPKVVDQNIAHLTFTPSLWRISSRVYSDFHYENINDGKIRNLHTKSLLELLGDHAEEKMDMLWEDFNDEFQVEDSESDKQVELGKSMEFCCVKQQALKMNERGKGIVASTRKGRIVVGMKVMKRLFLLYKMARLKKS